MRIFFIFIILILISQKLYSQDLFKSSFNNIEFFSTNIDNDKELRINELKKDILLSILKKTLDEEKYKEISLKLNESLINSFVKNVIINDEKIINNKYFSKVKINFNKKKLINYFRLNKTSYVEYLPDSFLLIIYEKDGINNNLFSSKNSFYYYFLQNQENNNIFQIPNLDINDRYLLNKDDILNKNYKKIKFFSEKYNSLETIIVIADIEKNFVNYEILLLSRNEIIQKKLEFSEFNHLKFFNILKLQSIDLWKKINNIQNQKLNILSCNINYYNLLELKEIRNRLDNISLIRNYISENINYKNIEYKINYYGNYKILLKIFKINNLKINKSKDSCFISLL